MVNQKAYKGESVDSNIMLPGDLKGSPDESLNSILVFVDAGFFSKLKKKFGEGKYLGIDFLEYANLISRKEKCELVKLFYYTAPPFQSGTPTREEELRKEKFDNFKDKLVRKGIIVREGRCQRLKIDGEFVYNQKAVDILLAMDLMSVPLDYPKINKIILISSDSDFVPVVKALEEKNVKTILYTYYDKKRNTPFSRSNYLIKSVYKYKIISKEDLLECQIK